MIKLRGTTTASVLAMIASIYLLNGCGSGESAANSRSGKQAETPRDENSQSRDVQIGDAAFQLTMQVNDPSLDSLYLKLSGDAAVVEKDFPINADGKYSIKGLKAGKYDILIELRAKSDLKYKGNGQAEVTAGKTTNAEVTLSQVSDPAVTTGELVITVVVPNQGPVVVDPKDPPTTVECTTLSKKLAAYNSYVSRYKQYAPAAIKQIQDGVDEKNVDLALAPSYYDAIKVHLSANEFFGNNNYDYGVKAALSGFRDMYILANDGKVPGYWAFSDGLRRHFELTGDQKSKNAVMLQAVNAAFSGDEYPIDWVSDADLSRETARAITHHLNAEALGAKHRARTDELIAMAIGHMEQWFVKKTYKAYKPFMVGITAEALGRVYDYTKDEALKAKIKNLIKLAADTMMAHDYDANSKSFVYLAEETDGGGRDPAPDLNMLIAHPVYNWAALHFCEQKYRDLGDQLVEGSVKGAYLVGGKQFNQSYMWGFEYLKGRTP